MSNLSPSRLRTKTSDLTDFFRGAGNSLGQPRHSQSQKDATSMNLEVPSGDEMSRKKITRIPLFGRSRKKSTQSTASSPFVTSSGVRESTETGVHLSRASSSSAVDSRSTASFELMRLALSATQSRKQFQFQPFTSQNQFFVFLQECDVLTIEHSRRPSEASIPTATNPPPLPVPSKPPSRVPTSLSSKFAATFSHSRSSKVTANAPPHTELRPKQPVSYPSGLVPPDSSSRSVSQAESGPPVETKALSTTTRPTRPTITVSMSADDDDEFKDLFTRSTEELEQYSRAVELRARLQNKQSDEHKLDTRSTPSPSSPVEVTSTPSIYKRGHTPASAIAAAVRHQHVPSIGSDRPPSTSSKNSRKNSDSDKSIEKIDRTSTPRPSEPRESPRLVGADKEKVLPPSLSRRSTMAAGSLVHYSDGMPSSLRSRTKLASTLSRSRPPTIPLPLLPPSSPPPLSPLPPSPTIASKVPDFATASFTSRTAQSESGSSRKAHVRPRAHTISSSTSVPPSPLSQSLTTADMPTTSSKAIPPPVEDDALDIDSASPEQLRQALKTRNEQYAEVTARMLKMTEQHNVEVSTLEKKIATLEKEARKRDTQIKGFTWMLNDGESPQAQPKPLPPGILNQSRFASSAVNIVSSDSEYEVQRIPPPSAPRRLYYQSDSGVESHATSGAESVVASGGSATESISSAFRVRKLRRPYLVSDGTQSITRSGTVRSSKVPPATNNEKTLPEVPYLPASTATKRSSISSTTVSPSSSTSSLLPPSPSITMSSLSAIPEGSKSQGTLHPARYDSSSEQQDERRAARTSHRTSVSSLTSSSTAASSSYSANMKRSRPPSIAQVLEKSPSNMNEVLEKMRSLS
ncbi:hypothetical protein CVT25_010355 [Psilocybe cyanescens]|uniref:Uncharacterized protein n=1 Tax=Psilocybe cyanescens TaxID=93625 RepID=A0A409XP21_PSICY|nr:hypothetical protein CVT25_010355 [Psilocybe cyanescens]